MKGRAVAIAFAYIVAAAVILVVAAISSAKCEPGAPAVLIGNMLVAGCR